MPSPKYLLPLSLSVGLLMANAVFAQAPAAASTADTAAAPAASSASGSAPDGTAPARGRRGGRGTAAPQGSAAPRGTAAARGPAAAPAAWDRPADGKPLFTEDFESGALNDKIWSTHAKGKTTITVEQDNVAHGKNALHFHVPAGSSGDYAFVGMVVPEALREHFYGRAYVSINGIPAGHCVLMLAGSTGIPLADFLEIGTSRNRFQPSYQLNKPLPPERPRGEKTYSQGDLPVGHWACIEWEFIEKPNRIVIWVDGKLTVNQPIAYQIVKTTGPTIDSGLTGGFFEFNLGFRAWGGAVANDVDIYYDDIAIGDKPIGQLTPVAAAPTASAGSAAK